MPDQPEGTGGAPSDDRAYHDEQHWFRSSDDVRKSYVRGIEAFDVRPVEYSVIDDLAIFEGDIVLGTAGMMMPTGPAGSGPAQLEWKVQNTRQAGALLTWFIEVKNLTGVPVDVQAGYAILNA